MGLTASVTNMARGLLEVDALPRIWQNVWWPGGRVACQWCVCAPCPALVFRVRPDRDTLHYEARIGTAFRAGCKPGISRGGVLVSQVPFFVVVLCFLDSRMVPGCLDVCWIGVAEQGNLDDLHRFHWVSISLALYF